MWDGGQNTDWGMFSPTVKNPPLEKKAGNMVGKIQTGAHHRSFPPLVPPPQCVSLKLIMFDSNIIFTRRMFQKWCARRFSTFVKSPCLFFYVTPLFLFPTIFVPHFV